MPNYVYNVVYRGREQGVARNMKPQRFSGTAHEFAREMLLDWMASHNENANRFVVVNVWDADQESVGVPGKSICQLSNHDLDEGPFDPNQIYVEYSQYYVFSAGYNIFADRVLAPGGTDSIPGAPFGLVAAGEGPALAVRLGHSGCWISLQIVRLDAEPAAELDEWEAVEQVTIKPSGEVRVIAGLVGKIEDHYPDIRGTPDTGYLTLRVSARGRGSESGVPDGPQHPRHNPLEHHLIQTWPMSGPAPKVVLKRDAYSGRQEDIAARHGR